ncbi:t-SNARE [Entophlyctis helioformis]|nr:t-SNARE [Entophlyctis helioformis]
MSRDRLGEIRTNGRTNQNGPSYGGQQPAAPAALDYSRGGDYGGSRGGRSEYGAPPSLRDGGSDRGGRDDYGRGGRGGYAAGGRNDEYEMSGRNSPPRGGPPPRRPPRAGRGGGGDFYSEVDEINASIDAVNRNIATIERLHNRALVGVRQDEAARINRDLDAVQTETSDMISDARQRLQRLSNETKTMRGPEVNARKAQQSTLAKKLMDVAQTYQNVQVSYKQKYRQRMEREIRIARPDASREDVERALDSHSGPVFAQEMLSSRIGEQRRALQEVQGRHEELRKMEQSIEELAQLFLDMKTLLDTQQEMIDTIDTHVENAQVYVEQGSTELTQAIKYREASRKRLWWVLAIVLIVIVVLAAVLYWQRCSLLKIDCPPSK